MSSAIRDTRKDVRLISVISVVHLFSHFYQLTLAPVFPLIKVEMGLTNVELGLLITVFFIASAVFQTPAGFLVDRFGARPVLLGGLGMLSLAVTGYSFAPSYEIFLVLTFLAGMGNSVFHPADYSLMNNLVSPHMMGRAFSFHTNGGHFGFALGPAVMAVLAASIGWRDAAAVVGLVGVVLTVVLVIAGAKLFEGSQSIKGAEPDTEIKSDSGVSATSISVLFQPSILALFLFFTILAMGLIGMQNFTPTALVAGRGFDLVSASGALTGFLFGAPLGIFVGGYVADKIKQQDMVALICIIIAGILVFLVPVLELFGWLLTIQFFLAGIFFGLALPNRDMVIRAAIPKGASGRVFGFVYGGLDTGAAITPAIYGWFVDLGRPDWVFFSSGVLLSIAALIIFATARAVSARG
jgi:MFS transporter, FSR family, fosmidomycin resistance protein